MKLDTIENAIQIIKIIKCLSNSLLILFLFFWISLHNFIPLSDNKNKVGINIIFCNNNELKEKINPFFVPSIKINVEIVYPNLNPW